MTRAGYDAQGYSEMSERVLGGGDWSIAAACPYRDGWQREAWQSGAWRLLQELRQAKQAPGPNRGREVISKSRCL